MHHAMTRLHPYHFHFLEHWAQTSLACSLIKQAKFESNFELNTKCLLTDLLFDSPGESIKIKGETVGPAVKNQERKGNPNKKVNRRKE